MKVICYVQEVDQSYQIKTNIFENIVQCLNFELPQSIMIEIKNKYQSVNTPEGPKISYKQALADLKYNHVQGEWQLKSLPKERNRIRASDPSTKKSVSRRSSQQQHKTIDDDKISVRSRVMTASSVASSRHSIVNRNKQLKQQLIFGDPNHPLKMLNITEQERFFRKNVAEFPDYFSAQDSQAAGSQAGKRNSSFKPQIIKSMLAQYFDTPDGQPQIDIKPYQELINMLYKLNVDYRKMNFVRLLLLREFDPSASVDKIHVAHLLESALKIKNFQESDLYGKLVDVLESDQDRISLKKFQLLVDLYHFMPYFRKMDKNASNDVYFIMSSNKVGHPGDIYHRYDNQRPMNSASSLNKSNLSSPQVTSLHECLTLLTQKILQRFKSIAQAFRFFDLRSSGKISLGDFSFILNQLHVKYSRQQILEMFQFLDQDKDNFLTYNEFCSLSEEILRDIDPFDRIVQQVRQKQENEDELNSTGFISKDLAAYKDRKENNLGINASSTNANGTRLDRKIESPFTSISGTTPKQQLVNSFLHRKFERKPHDHVDMGGGAMKNIMNYQYERDYLQRAFEDDNKYQQQKRLRKMGIKRLGGDTLTSKKRSETNHRKLRILNSSGKASRMTSQSVLSAQVEVPKALILGERKHYYPDNVISKIMNKHELSSAAGTENALQTIDTYFDKPQVPRVVRGNLNRTIDHGRRPGTAFD